VVSAKESNEMSPVAVLKIGGSILRSLRDYRKCAAHVAARLDRDPVTRLVVVVSARYGVTNRLAQLARALHTEPDDRAQDLLWSTGETYSVAVLTLALRGLGIDAAGLSVHECGLRVDAVTDVTVDASPLRLRLTRERVLVVPGFLARDARDAVVTLGRGGSDLSAVKLAIGLNATHCEIVKDVAGYFTADPQKVAQASAIAHLSYAEAIELADGGCGVVQAAALRAAADAGLPIHVRALTDDAPGTWVTTDKECATRSQHRLACRSVA